MTDFKTTDIGPHELTKRIRERRERNDWNEWNDVSERVSPFPVEALPGTLARLVKEGSKSMVCPPDMIAVPLLVAMASAIGNSRTLMLNEGWGETAVLWATVVARPGEKKSPSASLALKAPREVGRRLYRDWQKDLDEHKRELREYAVDVKSARDKGHAAPPEPLPPVLKRTTVDDTTLEALMLTLEANPRGVIQARDELDAWFRSMDQYKSGKGSDRQAFLSLWSSSPVTVDRKGNRESIFLQSPFLCLYGTIQPGILPELGDGREDGLLDRFLYSYPEPVPPRWSDDGISPEATKEVRDLYEKLRALDMGIDEYGDPEPSRVRFTPEAKGLFVEVYNAHCAERSEPGFPNRLRGPWAKLEGYFARIILLLTLMRCMEEGSPERVETGDVLRASVLLDYFKSHARKVYGLLGSGDRWDALAKDVADALEQNGGTLEGSPSEVLNRITVLTASPHLPGRPNELTKDLKKIAERSPNLIVETGTIGTGNDQRRYLKIFLANVVPVVPVVPGHGDEH